VSDEAEIFGECVGPASDSGSSSFPAPTFKIERKEKSLKLRNENQFPAVPKQIFLSGVLPFIFDNPEIMLGPERPIAGPSVRQTPTDMFGYRPPGSKE
jgi:hypothetical protein